MERRDWQYFGKITDYYFTHKFRKIFTSNRIVFFLWSLLGKILSTFWYCWYYNPIYSFFYKRKMKKTEAKEI